MKYVVVVCYPDARVTHEVHGVFGCEDAARQFIKNDLGDDAHEAEAIPLIDQQTAASC